MCNTLDFFHCQNDLKVYSNGAARAQTITEKSRIAGIRLDHGKSCHWVSQIDKSFPPTFLHVFVWLKTSRFTGEYILYFICIVSLQKNQPANKLVRCNKAGSVYIIKFWY